MDIFKDWRLTDFLDTTPYGNDEQNIGKLSEDDFYNNGFFIEPTSWRSKCEEILTFYNIAGIGNINIILLHGYQGTGKTTFLHWALKKTDYFNDYGKIILDMEKVITGAPNNSKNPFIVFEIFFLQQLNNFYSKKPSEVITFLKLLLLKYNLLNVTTFNEKHDDGSNFWQKLRIFIENFKTDVSGLCIENDFIVTDFFKDLYYTETCLLFLLLYFYFDDFDYEEEYGFKKPSNDIYKYILIFDNIDGVRLEQSNARFPKTIIYLYEQFCRITKILEFTNIPILKFVFSVRDYNYALLDLQTIDKRQVLEINFEPPENIDKIMEKRIEIANYNGGYDNVISIYKRFFYDEKFHTIFLPLFNYNIRKLALNFSSISILLNGDGVKKYLNMKNKIRKNKLISSIEPSYTNGLRGIFYAIIIKALIDKDNLRHVLLYDEGEGIELTDENGDAIVIKINPCRIILTIIHCLTDYNDKSEKVISDPIGLGKVYDAFTKMFNGDYFIDIFFEKLTGLFRLHEKNWCHLISFRNKQVFNVKVFKKEIIKLKTNNNISFLNKIEVKINRSAHIYLTKIVTHYEFYSMRNHNNKESLFLYDDSFKCLNNMDSVWSIVGPCLSSLINYLKYTKVEDFEATNLCLKDNYKEGVTKTALAFRIIHTHLRYIDDYRKYIYFLIITGRSNINFMKMNKEIIRRQYRYIIYLRHLCKARPTRYNNKLDEFLINLKKQFKEGYIKYISLLNDKRELPSDNL